MKNMFQKKINQKENNVEKKEEVKEDNFFFFILKTFKDISYKKERGFKYEQEISCWKRRSSS